MVTGMYFYLVHGMDTIQQKDSGMAGLRVKSAKSVVADLMTYICHRKESLDQVTLHSHNSAFDEGSGFGCDLTEARSDSVISRPGVSSDNPYRIFVQDQ